MPNDRPPTTPLPIRFPCEEPGGAACPFNLAGDCCHALNSDGRCPLTPRYSRPPGVSEPTPVPFHLPRPPEPG